MMTNSLVRLAIVSAVAVAGLAAGAVPALASNAEASATPQSSFFAGYAAHVSAVKSETTSFILTKATCTASNQVVAIGALAFTSPGHPSGGGVLDDCTTGSPRYIATALVAGAYTGLPMTVKPGDRIRVSLSITAAKTTITVSDLTTNVSKSATDAGGTFTGVNVGILGDFVGGTLQDVPNFGSISFTRTMVNGAAIGTLSPTPVNRVTSGGVLQVETGPLNAAGTGFKETFKHS